MGNRSLFKKATAAGLALLLLAAGLPPLAASAGNCKDWNKEKFFESATAAEVTACLSAGEDPNKPDLHGLTALHRAARDTSDPAVIEALLDAGANPRAFSVIGRLPWDFARKNDQIKGSDAYQRLRIGSAKKPKKADWSRVQAVPKNRKTEVRLNQDAASRESRRIKGRFDSATADSITLVLEDGQTQTVQKQAVRKVLVFRPFLKRWPGWVALGATFLFLEAAFAGDFDRGFHVKSTLPITAVAFFISSGRHTIYDVPPRHRTRPQGGPQSGNQDTASEKQKGPRRD